MNIPTIVLVALSVRIVLCVLGILIVISCFASMRNHRRGRATLVILQNNSTKQEFPVFYWENSIGRGKNCDIVIDDSTMSRNHAVLFRRKDGWFISDTHSKSGVSVNGEKVKNKTKLNLNDTISFGRTTLTLRKAADSREISSSYEPQAKAKPIRPARKLLLVTLFFFIASAQPILEMRDFNLLPLAPMALFLLVAWLFFLISTRLFKRCTFELEALAIFLSGIGLTLISHANLEESFIQLASIATGMLLFCAIIWFIQNPDIVSKLRILIGLLAIALFAVNLVLAKEVNGARNWIKIASFSIQPSEFIKIAFIFVGAATLDELQTTRSLSGFIVFSIICIGSLFLMKDFGTACVFFVTFLIIAFMRSGSFRTLILSCSAAAIGLFIILTFKPYIKDRFAAWGHVWEHANDLGYQQTRVLTYSASGGLLGVGVGNGHLKNIFAATGDLMFGLVCEEFGLVLAVIIALTLAGLSFYSHSQSTRSRSTFYSIAACAAASMLVFQAALHIFGTTDLLPLTGVTLPFVSLGGSSMISSFGLLAFIKAADERTYSLRRS